MSKEFFDKQAKGIKIAAASWVADRGKPDTPENWNTCKFRMEDGTIHKVSRNDLENHDWKWIGSKGDEQG
jgi:hypothetical protein